MKANFVVAWLGIAIGCAPVGGFEGDGHAAVAAPTKQANDQSTEAADHASLRYDGKPFEHWRKILLTELQHERQMEAIKALGAFAANGHSKESAVAIAEFMSQPSRLSPDEREQTRLVSAAVTAMARANEEHAIVALAALPLGSSAMKEFKRQVQACFSVCTKSYPVEDLFAPSSSDQPADRTDFEGLVAMLKDQFPPGTWRENGGKSDIQMFEANRTLVLSGATAVHHLMVEALKEVRRTQPITRSYDVAAFVRSKTLTGQAQVDFGSLVDLITATIRPTSWDTAGGAGSLHEKKESLSLVVHQTAAVHREVEQLLEQLRSLQVKSIPISPNVP